jgi:cytoskeleton protein RodZ
LASSFGIGALLRKERLGQGRALDAIAADTKIAPRFLEAIESEDFDRLPGLIFTRNFVRQYALALKLNPDPLLAALPRQDESTIKLPDPPRRTRTPPYNRERRWHSVLSSMVWLLIAGGAGTAAYLYLNRSTNTSASSSVPVVRAPRIPPSASPAIVEQSPAPAVQSAAAKSPESDAPGHPVQVVLTAHEPAWVQVSADGKTAFIGTLKSNETREVSAAEQVKISTGNAGALTISLNGKTLDSLGPLGQVRVVKLTAEGPEFPKAPPPPPDPL